MGGRVLVVDDNLEVRRLLRAALETAGFAVVESASATEALGRLAESRPDALVMDLVPAETRGIDLLRSIRQRQELNELPIVFIGSHMSDTGRWQALRAGADWFMSKPFSVGELQHKVTELIRAGRPQRRARPAPATASRSRRSVGWSLPV